MKNVFYLFILLIFMGCEEVDLPEITVCPPGSPTVFALNVDYTTNTFLGGYTVLVPQNKEPFEMYCDYVSPGDFGSIAWYDKSTGTKLFAGTIIWMGTGEQTFPEKIGLPNAFPKVDITTVMPEDIVGIGPPGFDDYKEEIDFLPVWKAVQNLQCVSWVQRDTPVYAYLFSRSVGVGDPAEWYWTLFLRY